VAGEFCLFSLVFVRIVTTPCKFQVKIVLHNGLVSSGCLPIVVLGVFKGALVEKFPTLKNRPGGKVGDG
jgi:hypothetical protein